MTDDKDALEILLESKTLGEAVRRLRELRGLTLRGLGQKLSVSAPFLSDLEHDRRNFTKIPQLAEALGVDHEHLLRFDTRVPPSVIAFLRKNPLVVRMILASMSIEEYPND